MFKKTIALSMSLLLAASIGTNTFAAEFNPDDAGKMLVAIDKTNQDIESRIENAIKAADQLESQYLVDIQKLEEGDAVVNLKEQKSKLESDLQNTNDANKIDKINRDLEEINNKVAVEINKAENKTAAIESDINSLQLFAPDKKKLNDLQKRLDQKLDRYTDRTNKFTNDLDKLISDLYKQTLDMSNGMIKKAAEKGIQAESTWTLVELGGNQVWVDPIRVVH